MSSESTDNLPADEKVQHVSRAFARGGIVTGSDPTIVPARLDTGCVIPRGAAYYGDNLMSLSITPSQTGKSIEAKPDMVNHPAHYTSDPSGVECITVTRWRNFNIGNAMKYLWRAGLKDEMGQDEMSKQIEDLQKTIWYIKDEIRRLDGIM